MEYSSTSGYPVFPRKSNRKRRERQKGSEILEFTFVMLPLFAMMILLVNIAWSMFARVTLQHAVREGVRYAVTSQVMPGLGQKDSIRKIVQRNASFLLKSDEGWNAIEIHFYTPESVVEVPTKGNVGGNLVRVSVENYTAKDLMPWIPMSGLPAPLSPITMGARAWDRMESTPPTGAPAL